MEPDIGMEFLILYSYLIDYTKQLNNRKMFGKAPMKLFSCRSSQASGSDDCRQTGD